MRKVGEVNARLKQMEVALDDAELAKQNAETEAALAKEKAALSISEVKRIELMVCISCWLLLCYCSSLCTTVHLSFSFITKFAQWYVKLTSFNRKFCILQFFACCKLQNTNA